MGEAGSKHISEAEMQELRRCTSFTRNEIQDWYRRFYDDCPNGKMSKQLFMKMYGVMFSDVSKRYILV